MIIDIALGIVLAIAILAALPLVLRVTVWLFIEILTELYEVLTMLLAPARRIVMRLRKKPARS